MKPVAMKKEDFEHLVRDLFEEVFAGEGWTPYSKALNWAARSLRSHKAIFAILLTCSGWDFQRSLT